MNLSNQLLLLITIMPILLFGQSLKKQSNFTHSAQPLSSPIQDTIFHDDFSSGISSWTSVDSTGGSAYWEYRGTSTTPDVNTGSRGSCATPTDVIQSPTQFNGFVIFDSNWLDDPGSTCGAGQGTGVAPSPHKAYLQSANIDLTGYSSAILEFFSYARNFTSLLYVDISDDGGSTWTPIWKDEINFNTSEENNYRVSLHNYVGSTVQIRFRYSGEYYFWMLDDILIYEPENNFITLNEANLKDSADGFYQDYYTKIPQDVLKYDTLNLNSKIQNWGLVGQNVRLACEISGPSGFSFTDTSAAAFLDVAEEKSFEIPNVVIDGDIGTFTIDYSLVTDSVLSNTDETTASVSFATTNDLYQMDNGTPSLVDFLTPNQAFAVLYRIPTTVQVSGISAVFNNDLVSGQLSEGSTIRYSLYKWDSLDFTLEAASNLSSPSYSSGINEIDLEINATLTPGNYLAVAEVWGDTAVLVFDDRNLDAPAYFDIQDHQDINNQTYLSFGTTPMIRLLFDPCVGFSASVSVGTYSGGSAPVTVTTTGGTSPYSFSWSDTTTTSTGTNSFDVGNHSVTITDSAGCEEVLNFTVSMPLSGSITQIADISCFGQTNGGLTANATGGDGSYTYIWSNGGNTQTLLALGAGSYTVTIQDGSGSSITETYVLTEPDILTSNVAVNQPTSGSSSDGSAWADPMGGTTPYTYLWSNGANTDSIGGLDTGMYTVTITDANGCTTVNSVTLTVSGSTLAAQLVQTSEILCWGDANVTLTVELLGGNFPFSYSWDGFSETGPMLDSVYPGSYTVTVTDGSGDTVVLTKTVTGPDAVGTTGITQNPTDISASDGSIDITPFGGTPPYSFLWSSGQTTEDINGLFAGTYTVTITDDNGCEVTETYTLNEYPAGLESKDQKSFSLFPNPASTEFSIKGDIQSIQQIEIFEASGKQIAIYTEAPNNISIQHLKNQMITIRITTQSGSEVHRLVIQ